jgi:shikimate kinase/3-dehydroquinate synthase
MIRISEPQPPVVVLAGFMGSGKSEVGRLLAQRLGVELIDTDALIESRAGMSVVELFERHGEERFREMEVELCRELCPRGGAVISTGGGMLMNRENFRRLSAMGTVVLLECDAARREWIEATLKRRRPVYERIPFKVDTTGSTSAETVEEIVARLDPGSRVIHVNVGVRPFPLSANGRGPVTDGECRVVVGRGAASRLGWYLDEMGLALRSCVFVTSQRESRLTARIKPSLEAASIAHEVVKVADGDANKNLAQVRDLLDHLAASGAGRDSVVVSVGGGVTGDVAGFVASTYMRGVPFVQVPTTLVSQVDASIGGKVGVNHPRAKNLIGSIYQPVLVLSDPLMLEGLPFEEISNGMAEVVKTALIGSPELYEFVAAAVDEPRERKLVDPAFLEYCAFESARVKCEIVERDPFERDVRRVLNLGHTVGHALESALAYEGLRHGEAVALGTIAAIRVSVARGFAAPGLLDRTFSILRWCGLPTHTPPVDRELLIRSLALDKKRKSGQLFFVLPVEVGRVEIVGDVTDDELLDALW